MGEERVGRLYGTALCIRSMGISAKMDYVLNKKDGEKNNRK